ncbi:HNH endonuclease [Tundrisphaera sp. TA3]|uniref:HNH endonuclease n=1 Tax=Tundrisphaera sp. TA3 TaxID=3435775 RepID=UPI003EB6A3CA
MFKRLADIAKSVVGPDREPAPVVEFRSVMIQTLKNPPKGGVDLAEIRAKTGVSDEGASKVIAELYLRFARKVAADGVITDAERSKLDGLAAVLGLDRRKATSIEQIAGAEVYEEAAQVAMADGVVTLEEAAHLAEMRRNLLPEPDDVDDEVEADLAAMFDRDAFRDAVVRDFKANPGTFDLRAYADHSGAPDSATAEVADELYAKFAIRVCADGIITAAERGQLDALARAFHVAPSWAARIEESARRDAYRRAVLEALADGVITPPEASRLESLRVTLGITTNDAARSAGALAAVAYEALIRKVIESGAADPRGLREVQRFKSGLGLSDADTVAMIRGRAIDLYREAFAEIVQDGDITPQQEELLAWLEGETGLDAAAVAPYAEQLAEAKRLAGYRSGRLPLVESRKLFKGGETCHWDSPCRLLYQTAKDSKQVEGELVATTKRIMFVSPTRSFSFAPWKVVDIEGVGPRVRIKTDARQGNGDYYVTRPKDLEAILIGLAKRGKYTASNGTGSEKSRHIPGDVKRAVWARDGGRCVQYQDDRYLEFDHIIPHTLGGANTFGNVQLLCRKCNNEKRDRI